MGDNVRFLCGCLLIRFRFIILDRFVVVAYHQKIVR